MIKTSIHFVQSVRVTTDEHQGTRWVKMNVVCGRQEYEVTLFPVDGQAIDTVFAASIDPKTLTASKEIT